MSESPDWLDWETEIEPYELLNWYKILDPVLPWGAVRAWGNPATNLVVAIEPINGGENYVIRKAPADFYAEGETLGDETAGDIPSAERRAYSMMERNCWGDGY